MRLGLNQIRAGDAVLVSGPVGDHGTAVLLAREDFGLRGDLASDAASILPLAQALWNLPGLRFMRDPTRGGLVTVMHDIARITGSTVHLDETAIPVHPPVRAVCNMLGYDPLYLACEGRIVAVLSAENAPRALDAWRAMPSGDEAAIMGRKAAARRAILDVTVAQRSQTACWMTMHGKRGRRYETFPELGSL